MNKLTSILLLVISVMFFSALAEENTILVTDFESTVEPVQHGKGVSTVIDSNFTPEYVDGKFGKGLRVKAYPPKKIKEDLPVKYNIGKLMDQRKQGTIEFWCRMPFTTGGRATGSKIKVEFFRSGSLNTNVTMYKGIYNFLVFRYMRAFRNICYAALPARSIFREENKWNHIAVSWDENDGRTFYNGKLIAVSREWQQIYFTKFFGIGLPAKDYIDYDDLKFSRRKLYYSNFNVPDKPLSQIPPVSTTTPPAAQKCPDNVLFKYNASENSAYAVCAAGYSGIFINWNSSDSKGINLKRLKGKIDNTLGFSAKGNINRSFGRITVRLKLSPGFKTPFYLFDSSFYSISGRTGIQVIVTKDEKLKWQYIDNGREVSSLQSKKLDLKTDAAITFAFEWGGSTVELYCNGKKVASADGLAMPPCLGNYAYICSMEDGKNTCECTVLDFTVELPKQRPGDKHE